MADYPTISVIIPVYNAASYLDRCIHSILCQTFTDLELILIDDGSSDDSGAICDCYAGKDARVIVKHCQNQGVSMARNEGLAMARGGYISFVDSDDYLDLSAYEKMLSLAREKHAQVVWCDFAQFTDTGQCYYLKAFEEGADKHTTISNMITYGPNGGALWNYLLIDSNLIKGHSLAFPARYKFGEDFWFGLQVHVFSQKSVKANEVLYYYYMGNPGSISHNEDPDSTLMKWNCLSESYSFLKEQGLFEEFRKEISWRMLLAKTPWVMSPSTFHLYYSRLPEVNSYVNDNPLLGGKMKVLMRLLNKKHKTLASLLVNAYSIKNNH